jgi:hypothetical protein
MLARMGTHPNQVVHRLCNQAILPQKEKPILKIWAIMIMFPVRMPN